MLIALALLLQDAPAATTAAPPDRFSVLANSCPSSDQADIIVCSQADQRLPLPDERVPDGPIPTNPYLRPDAAMAAAATPCPISRNCVVGFGGPIIDAAMKGAYDLGKKAFAKKIDKTGRVPIDLSDPGAVSTAGKVLP